MTCAPTAGSIRAAIVALLATVLVAACSSATQPSSSSAPGGDPIRIGGVFPISGNAAGLAAQEVAGVRIALAMVNADGGVSGRPLELDVRDLESAADAPAAIASLKADGVAVVLGAYSSDLSIAASSAASAAGLVYWEAGAVADKLTDRGLPLVFRVGPTGGNLGANSATFAVNELAPRLGRTTSTVRLAIVAARDQYAASVADAARATAQRLGAPIVADESYDMSVPNWPALMADLAAAQPDVIILASHIPDGIAFRRAMLGAGLHVGALIGSTMAECDPDFAGELGPDAVGVFASDRPTGGFQPDALEPAAQATYARFAQAWSALGAQVTSPNVDVNGDGYIVPGEGEGEGEGEGAAGASPGTYTISGPVELGTTAAGPSEEGLSGFSATWALAHYVLPAALAGGSLEPAAITGAARMLDLPPGTLPNGAGLRFSTDPATLGQNTRATGVIWQWQAVRSYSFVWPPTYATGGIQFVPLSR